MLARALRRARRATVAGLDGLVPDEWAQLFGVGVEFMGKGIGEMFPGLLYAAN